MTMMLIALVLLATAAGTLVYLRRQRTSEATEQAAPVVELATIGHTPRHFRHFDPDLVIVTPRLVEQEPAPLAKPVAPSTSVDNAMAVGAPDRSSPFAAPILQMSKIALPDDGADMDFFGTGASSEPSRQYLPSPGGVAMQSPLSQHRAS